MKRKQNYLTGLLYIIFGNIGYAVAYNCFFAGNNIAAGGFGGLGLVLSHFIPLTVGTIVMIISVPVFIWSYVVQGFKYTVSALISTAAFSLLVDLFSFLPSVTDNRLLAALCGGAIYGASAMILIRGRVSGSGTDLLARLIVTKVRFISLGAMLFTLDAAVILISIIAFGDIEGGIYAAGSMFVTSYVLDHLVRGLNKASLFQVITNVPVDMLTEQIYKKLERGVTLVPVTGVYKKEERNMLLIVVSNRQVYEMKDIIRQYAPDAFVMLLSANEIMGEGFHGLDVTVPVKELEDE